MGIETFEQDAEIILVGTEFRIEAKKVTIVFKLL